MATIEATVADGIGRIQLNRPNALNAMDTEMFAAIEAALDGFAADRAVRAVTIRGAGKAFCAGGDIRHAAALGAAGDDRVALIYRHEYRADLLIHRFPKPVVALVHGACMGGGMGLAMHAAIRVVADGAVLAMPETEIGFFPDCGVSWLLARLPGAVGTYLALTGTRMSAADARAIGLATHVVATDALDAAERIVAGSAGVEALPEALAALGITTAPSELAGRRGQIDACFGGTSVAEIVSALERDPSDWAAATLATLRRMSPTALCIAFEVLRRERELTLEASFALENRLASHLARTAEFREGVRAVIVDKDRAPKWSPARLADVDAPAVARLVERMA